MVHVWQPVSGVCYCCLRQSTRGNALLFFSQVIELPDFSGESLFTPSWGNEPLHGITIRKGTHRDALDFTRDELATYTCGVLSAGVRGTAEGGGVEGGGKEGEGRELPRSEYHISVKFTSHLRHLGQSYAISLRPTTQDCFCIPGNERQYSSLEAAIANNTDARAQQAYFHNAQLLDISRYVPVD